LKIGVFDLTKGKSWWTTGVNDKPSPIDKAMQYITSMLELLTIINNY
jgi:hypothetical protein